MKRLTSSDFDQELLDRFAGSMLVREFDDLIEARDFQKSVAQIRDVTRYSRKLRAKMLVTADAD